MTPNTLQSIWESKTAYKVSEAGTESVVDGVNILARVSGPTFFPETTSRNGVYYTLEAWENALSDPELQQRLEGRLVLGTFGHDIEITDEEVRKGLFSHITTKLWIEDGIGYAEHLVLNTEPGRNLNTLLRAGARISTSTKANGYLAESQTADGYSMVEPEGFTLERIDFVLDPGYLEAKPELLESFSSKGKQKMDKTRTPIEIMEAHVSDLRARGELSDKRATELQEALSASRVEVAEAKAAMKLYEAFGTPVEIHEKLKKLSVYEAIDDDPESLADTVEAATETIEDLTDKLDAATQELENTQEALGDETPETYKALLAEADAAVEQLAAFKEVAETPEQVKDLMDAAAKAEEQLTQYQELGTVEELEELIDTAEKVQEQLEGEEVAEIADEVGVEPEIVESLRRKGMSLKEARKLLVSMKESFGEVEGQPDEDDPYTDDVNEDDDEGEEGRFDDGEGEGDDDEDEGRFSVQESAARFKRGRGRKAFAEGKVKAKSKARKPAAAAKTTLAEALISRNRAGNRNARTNVRSTRK
jgi:hypothetical protein